MTYTTQTPARDTRMTSRFADERHNWGCSVATMRNLLLGAIEHEYHKGLTVTLTPC